MLDIERILWLHQVRKRALIVFPHFDSSTSSDRYIHSNLPVVCKVTKMAGAKHTAPKVTPKKTSFINTPWWVGNAPLESKCGLDIRISFNFLGALPMSKCFDRNEAMVLVKAVIDSGAIKLRGPRVDQGCTLQDNELRASVDASYLKKLLTDLQDENLTPVAQQYS